MTQTLWIVIVVVAVLVVLAVVLGLVLRRSRRISLREAEKRREELPPRRGGTYQARGDFNFAAGTDTAEPETPRRPAADAAPAPAAGEVAPEAPGGADATRARPRRRVPRRHTSSTPDPGIRRGADGARGRGP